MSMFYCKFLVKIFANVKANVIKKSQNHFLYLMKMILYIIYIYKCGGKEVKIHLIMSNTPTHPYTHTHTHAHTHIYIYIIIIITIIIAVAVVVASMSYLL